MQEDPPSKQVESPAPERALQHDDNDDGLPFALKPCGGFGRGLVSLRHFDKGEVILRETPMTYVPPPPPYGQSGGFHTSVWELTNRLASNPDHFDAILRDYVPVEAMPAWDGRDEVDRAKVAKNSGRSLDDVQELYRRVVANNITTIGGMDDKDAMPGFGFYRQLSWTNHSCAPNCRYATLCTRSGDMALVAVRQIKPNDQLCASYLDHDALKDGALFRRIKLFAAVGFICACERCKAEAV